MSNPIAEATLIADLVSASQAMLAHYGPPDTIAHLCVYPDVHPITLTRTAVGNALRAAHDSDLATASAGYTCTACGRPEHECSAAPCEAVLADREAECADDDAEAVGALRNRLEPLGYFIEQGALGYDARDAQGDLIHAANNVLQTTELEALQLCESYHRDDECTCDDRSWHGDEHDSACPLHGLPRLA